MQENKFGVKYDSTNETEKRFWFGSTAHKVAVGVAKPGNFITRKALKSAGL